MPEIPFPAHIPPRAPYANSASFLLVWFRMCETVRVLRCVLSLILQ